MRDLVVIGGRSHGKAYAQRFAREVCETALRDLRSRGWRFADGALERAIRAGVAAYRGGDQKIADAMTASLERSRIR